MLFYFHCACLLHTRRCPGGEGIYAFSTKFASEVFELVQENIVQGQPSNRPQSVNGSAEKETKGSGRQRSASSGLPRRSPPKEESSSFLSNRSQTLPASGAVSGSSLTSDSEVLQEKQTVSKPSQATPHTPAAPAVEPPAEPPAAESPPAEEAQEKESRCYICVLYAAHTHTHTVLVC